MQESQQQQNLSQAQVYTHPEGISYSQPEIRQTTLQPVYADEGNYVNAAAIRNYNHNIYANVFHDGHNYYALRGGVGVGGERGTGSLAVHATYSSPELNVQPQQPEQFTSGPGGETLMTTESLAYHFRPPPPYPRTSTSTPDLAIQATGPAHSDHADLVSSQPALSAGTLGGSTIPAHSDDSVDAGVEVSDMTSISSPVVSEGGAAGVGETLVAPNLAHLQVVDSAGDQEDTSSEHSYATFHAKESDESSDEAGKLTRRDSQSQIQIRMLGPKEAPPQSKTKEVATLRESFRRMMIARSGSLRGSRKSFRESAESKPSTDPVNLTPVSEQPLDTSSSLAGISPDMLAHVGIPMPPNESTSEMQEIVEKLGDPPPYPGSSLPAYSLPSSGDPPVYTSPPASDPSTYPSPSGSDPPAYASSTGSNLPAYSPPAEGVPELPPRDSVADLAQVVPAPPAVVSPAETLVTPGSQPPGGMEEPEEKQSETQSMAESSSEADSGMPHVEEEEDPGVESASDTESEKVGGVLFSWSWWQILLRLLSVFKYLLPPITRLSYYPDCLFYVWIEFRLILRNAFSPVQNILSNVLDPIQNVLRNSLDFIQNIERNALGPMHNIFKKCMLVQNLKKCFGSYEKHLEECFGLCTALEDCFGMCAERHSEAAKHGSP